MKDSQMQGTPLPFSTEDAIPIATAGDVPLRVLVRNNTGDAVTSILLGYEEGDVNNTTSRVYTLPDGQADVFVLAPHQALYGKSGSAIAHAISSVAKSEAFPIVAQGS